MTELAPPPNMESDTNVSAIPPTLPASIPPTSTIAAPMMSAPPSADRPNKRQKVAIACDVCRAKKVKCDSVRPICGPCSKRQHGAPCEYTTVTRTSHGPTKGYVHHLELKLRELQAGRDLEDVFNTRSAPMSNSPSLSQSQTGQDSSSYATTHNGNGWIPRPWVPPDSPENIARQSLSLGPPAAPTAREPHLNGSATPDSNGDRRGQPDAAINGRQSSYIHQVKDTVPESTPEHREALSRSPLAEHQNTMSTTIRNKHARSVDYILPSRKTADGLMETYWETAHALFPIIDIDAFNRAYQSIWSGTPIENESQIMCTLNVIFALASSFSDSMEVKARVQSADVFFDRAQELFEMDLWNASGQSLESVQCLLLICQFLQSRSASRQAWVFIGLAVSTAESLFLHMTTDRVLTERQKITHQVVWHGCLYMKRILAMHDKRPSMIDALAVTMVSKPFTRNQHAVRSEELYFYHTLALSEILDEILLQTHKSRNMPDNPADLIHESVLSSITTLDGQLSRWRAELPPQFHQVTFTQAPPRTPIHRQANSIRLQYYNARILLFRPILISWCRLQAGSLQAPGYAESFQAHTSSTCSTLCLHSSLDMIEFIYTRLPPFEPNGPPPAPTQQPPIDPSNPSATAASPSHSQSSPPLSPLPAWWDVITYLHTSALIILLSRLNRTLCMSVPPTTIEGAFKTSLDCLRQFARLGGSALAERSIRYLESLATKTDIARMDLEVSREIQEQGRFRPGVGGGRLSDLEVGVRGLEWVEVGVYEL